mgnify:CR=1 FL=1
MADNGASVYLRDELVYRDLIDRDLYHEVLALATATEGSVPVLCAFDNAYVLERDRCHEDVVSIYYRSITYVESFEELDVDSNKISIYFPGWDSKQKNDEVYSPAFASRLYLTCAGNEWLDFMNIGVDKGSGIRHLAQHLGIDLSDIAAFGDTYNDIPMLDIVGHSYVMANAAEHMHDHGKFLAPSNNEAGVLTVIDHIVDAMGTQPEPVAANQTKGNEIQRGSSIRVGFPFLAVTGIFALQNGRLLGESHCSLPFRPICGRRIGKEGIAGKKSGPAKAGPEQKYTCLTGKAIEMVHTVRNIGVRAKPPRTKVALSWARIARNIDVRAGLWTISYAYTA